MTFGNSILLLSLKISSEIMYGAWKFVFVKVHVCLLLRYMNSMSACVYLLCVFWIIKRSNWFETKTIHRELLRQL